jgi:hypothetical protein
MGGLSRAQMPDLIFTVRLWAIIIGKVWEDFFVERGVGLKVRRYWV